MMWKRNLVAHWAISWFLLCLLLPSPAFLNNRLCFFHKNNNRILVVSASASTKSSTVSQKQQQPLLAVSDDSSSSSSSSSCPRVIKDESSSSCSSSNDQTPSSVSSYSYDDAYHLIWSPHVLRKMLITTPLLVLTTSLWNHYATTSFPLLLSSSSLLSVVIRNWILPLLASSCCLLQLGLNLLSVGCAGFSTYLGPFRPYLLSLFLVMMTRTSSAHHQNKKRLLVVSFTQVVVAFLPEMVHLFNTWRRRRTTSATTATNNSKVVLQATVQLEIPSMGCVACINTIDGALQRQATQRAQVVQAASALHPLNMKKGGSATIRVVAESEAALTELVSQLIEATAKSGFEGATVTSIIRKEAYQEL